MLSEGERARDFVLPLGSGEKHARFYARAGGRPTLLAMWSGSLPVVLSALCARVGDAPCFGVRAPNAEDWPGATVFNDPDGAVAKAYRVGQEARLWVLGPDLRVCASFDPTDSTQMDAILEALAPPWTEEGPIVSRQAPVLFVPNVLAPPIRGFLCSVWDKAGHRETGVERSGQEAIEHDHKRRQDHTVTDPKLLKMLTSTVGRRVLPEIQRAFAASVDRFEGFKIVRYGADDGGFFGPHRDNISPQTAHRRFGLSLNLNDDYDGGELCFPGYGPERYRAPAGGAMVFSGALLHEVRPVTRGQRFAALSFIYSGPRNAA